MSEEIPQALSTEDLLALLSDGEIAVHGLLPGSSNYTFLAEVNSDRYRVLAVYKPRNGETPLWDFPTGTLCQRELAAFLVSEALGWRLVPPTVLRGGPYGYGAVQFFVDADFSRHYFTIQDDPAYRLALQQVAAFDLVINNADRKAGHCLIDQTGRLWAIDHGVCFHVQPKLRTVIWEFAGQPLPQEVSHALVALHGQLVSKGTLYQQLAGLLSPAELLAVVRRLERLLDCSVYPAPDPRRRSYPWPLI